jgi:hypothetical protein
LYRGTTLAGPQLLEIFRQLSARTLPGLHGLAAGEDPWAVTSGPLGIPGAG